MERSSQKRARCRLTCFRSETTSRQVRSTRPLLLRASMTHACPSSLLRLPIAFFLRAARAYSADAVDAVLSPAGGPNVRFCLRDSVPPRRAAEFLMLQGSRRPRAVCSLRAWRFVRLAIIAADVIVLLFGRLMFGGFRTYALSGFLSFRSSARASLFAVWPLLDRTFDPSYWGAGLLFSNYVHRLDCCVASSARLCYL